jgi:hypothetical protein
MNYFDKFTGKPIDKLSDRLPRLNGGKCELCGTPTIDCCPVCGAPQCCPKCCEESMLEYKKFNEEYNKTIIKQERW